MSRDELSEGNSNSHVAGLQLDRIVFIGRTYDEYRRMFRLGERDLAGKTILDCPAGPCSFAAEMNARGVAVVACDMAYAHSYDELAAKGEADVVYAMQDVERNRDSYNWNYFGSVGELQYTRMKALNGFLTDFRKTQTASGSSRYIAAQLPSLPFADGAFDLILSAHFLFLYADRMDFAFHAATLRELMRVAREEIRIFPVVDLSGKRYAHLDQIMRLANSAGFAAQVTPAPYEFAPGANAMLRLRRIPAGQSH